jgi:hypothetical protein
LVILRRMSEPRPGTDQLDAALRAFASADAFERDAAELRAELRRLRAVGRGAPPWKARVALPDALRRIGLEAAFLIAAAVFVGVVGFGAAVVVATMAAAWLVVCGVEWVALRERRATDLLTGEPYEQSLLDALRPSPSARSRSSSARR